MGYWDGDETVFYNQSNSGIPSDFCFELELIDDKELWINHGRSLTQVQINLISKTNDDSQSGETFTIYPNPTFGQFQINNDNREKRQYQVYTMSGELVLSASSSDQVWSASLNPGPYITGFNLEKLIG